MTWWGENMSDLASINTYLMETERQIGSAQMQIMEKEEKLSKLEDALTKLASNKSDFIGKKDICLEPEFTSKTLHGENASDLDDIRENQLQVSFVAIPKEQIDDAEDKIGDQIEVLEEEISSLEGTISSLESRRESLLAQKREVESES
ncbi:DUF5082 domain-containing protein [Virgibacillus sp. MSJ-26]|uniref:YwqH-like family protein n=1 Tax=Virgibacillus sp. MSJ-26 TaxID=2841522 RepID=UPI001C12916A|nr:DUF5082 family protein [Virgibacillus sp. MSJ-26]MBU5465354.1 DUF5082 domain-containing protein [Virgibacillus sp. MSJ-26]